MMPPCRGLRLCYLGTLENEDSSRFIQKKQNDLLHVDL